MSINKKLVVLFMCILLIVNASAVFAATGIPVYQSTFTKSTSIYSEVMKWSDGHVDCDFREGDCIYRIMYTSPVASGDNYYYYTIKFNSCNSSVIGEGASSQPYLFLEILNSNGAWKRVWQTDVDEDDDNVNLTASLSSKTKQFRVILGGYANFNRNKSAEFTMRISSIDATLYAFSADQTTAEQAGISAANAEAAANNAYNAVYNINGDTISAVRDANGTVLDAARLASAKIDTIQTSITNIQSNLGADTTPPEVFLGTLSGARAASGNSIKVTVEVSDNYSSDFSYSLDGITYYPLPADGVITVPVNNPGANLIVVWVQDSAGNCSRKILTIRKL
ncbi:MAG: hypothetical protein K6T65_11335 [Peptococcaceae bacterium]|nr:hypothetical protein [Peptococcaceae bacterium]